MAVLANIGVEITLTREVEDDIFYQLCLNSHELEFKQNMLIATVVGKLQHRYLPLVLYPLITILKKQRFHLTTGPIRHSYSF